jgi:anti-anti-sigma factor
MPVHSVPPSPECVPLDDDADWLVSAAGLAVHLTLRDSLMIVGLRGDVDGHTLPALDEALSTVFAQQPVRIVVDARNVGFCSVRGLTLLVGAAEWAAHAGTPYAVTGLSALHRHLIRTGWPDRDSSHLCHTSLSDALAEPLAEPSESARAERDLLRRAMRTRNAIEQAKGILMARHGCSPEHAFVLLSRKSQRANRALHLIAMDVVTSTSRSANATAVNPS